MHHLNPHAFSDCHGTVSRAIVTDNDFTIEVRLHEGREDLLEAGADGSFLIQAWKDYGNHGGI
jgi:hypothetical protein